MGYDCRARIIYGFRITLNPVNKKIMKYNENTGEPYSVNEHDYDELLIGENVIFNNRGAPNSFCCGEEIEGMEITRLGSDIFFGVTVGLRDYEWEELAGMPPLVMDFAERHELIADVYFVCKGG